MKAGRIMLL